MILLKANNHLHKQIGLVSALFLLALLSQPYDVFAETELNYLEKSLDNNLEDNSNGNHSSNLYQKWILVLEDPRPPRRQGWRGGNQYSASQSYDQDKSLQRIADDFLKMANNQAQHLVSLDTQWPIQSIKVHCLIFNIHSDDIESIQQKVRKDKRVKWLQPLNEFQLLKQPISSGNPQAQIDKNISIDNAVQDPYFELQSNFKDLQIDKLHPSFTGKGVSIAIIDSAVDIDHQDLKGADIHSLNFIQPINNDKFENGESHGTGVAGIMMAKVNNKAGIHGIAPSAKMFAYRSCWELKDRTACNSLTLARALDQAVKDRPDILNLSLTGPKDLLLDSILKVIISQKTVVVTAADTKRTKEDRFPGPNPDILFVGDTLMGDNDKEPYKPISNYISLSGQDIITTQPNDQYSFLSGSSFSTAHLSGLVALILQAKPNLEANRIKHTIKENLEIAQTRTFFKSCKMLKSMNIASRECL